MMNPPMPPEFGIELGNRRATQASAADRSSLVLASYNIRYAVGSHLIPSGLLRKVGYNFPLWRSKAVARNISKAARFFSDDRLMPRPDILALQESDKETGRAGRFHVAAALAGELDVQYLHLSVGIPRGIKPASREWWLNFEEQVALDDVGEMGVALLSHVPLENVARIDLPWHDCPWRPRLALTVTVTLGEETVRLVNVHIDPHGPMDNQQEQTQVVLDIADGHPGPVVVLGDFNSLSKKKAIEIRKLMESRGYSTPFPNNVTTWRGAGLRYHADWIFVRGLSVKRWGVAKPAGVSDHWPIWAEVELPSE
ncbi:MAG TPA: endonuclease/exonuclease/phosphatase family protein [Pyrinomonadaceae bacterium]|nr:endonuclease/exonuclease/phosphatase family protein [Pyrinomonadaceae bacterium]